MFEIYFFYPLLHNLLAAECVPVLLKRIVAFFAFTNSAMVTEPAFKRLNTGIKQRAQIVLEECAFVLGKFLQCKIHFAAFECGRENSERQLRRDLEHYPVGVTKIDCAVCLLNCPPAGTDAVA